MNKKKLDWLIRLGTNENVLFKYVESELDKVIGSLEQKSKFINLKEELKKILLQQLKNLYEKEFNKEPFILLLALEKIKKYVREYFIELERFSMSEMIEILKLELTKTTKNLGRKDTKITSKILEEAKELCEAYPHKSTTSILEEVSLRHGLGKQTILKWWDSNYRMLLKGVLGKEEYEHRVSKYEKKTKRWKLQAFRDLDMGEIIRAFKYYLDMRNIEKN